MENDGKRLTITIPGNMTEYLSRQDGACVVVSFNSAGEQYGYAHLMHTVVELTMLTRTCNNCGYDEIWRPELWESKCLRHSYGDYRYDTVFAWRAERSDTTLEQSFDVWLENQPREGVKYMTFGFGGEKKSYEG